MHVCYISQEYPPETGWGGVGAYTYEMAHALADAGNRVTVITRGPNGQSVSRDQGVEVHRISPRPFWNKIPFFWRMNRVWPDFSWAAMMRLRQINREYPIDVIEAAEVRADGFFVSLLPRRPKLITRLHTAQIFVDQFNHIPNERIRPWNYWFEKQSISRANLVTAPSQAVINLTQTWMPLTDRRIVLVPNPINNTRFAPALETSRKTVLYVGRLERNKGADTIMRALPILLDRFPALKFCFIGSDGLDRDGQSWRAKIEQSLTESHKARIHFGEVSREELAIAYQQAAVCILPSTWENSPYALLEAMACATPVVACNSGGTPELIEHGVNGFLIPVNDSTALAERVGELLSQSDLRIAMGRNARQKIEQTFSVEQVLPRMIAAYAYALAN